MLLGFLLAREVDPGDRKKRNHARGRDDDESHRGRGLIGARMDDMTRIIGMDRKNRIGAISSGERIIDGLVEIERVAGMGQVVTVRHFVEFVIRGISDAIIGVTLDVERGFIRGLADGVAPNRVIFKDDPGNQSRIAGAGILRSDVVDRGFLLLFGSISQHLIGEGEPTKVHRHARIRHGQGGDRFAIASPAIKRIAGRRIGINRIGPTGDVIAIGDRDDAVLIGSGIKGFGF